MKQSARMKVLVLGGTRFVGRHIARELTGRDHDVVCFHRGQTNCELPTGVAERFGDRNHDLNAVDRDHWDVVIDVNGYEPAQVARSLTLSFDRYIFISTVNVYADVSAPGASEDWPTLQTFDASDESTVYGAKKAACERLVAGRCGEHALILRPGMIVGAYDYTGRFTYWCERVARGGDFLVVAPPARPVQFIDAADIARFAVDALEHDMYGVYNVVGPRDPITLSDLLTDCQTVAARRGMPQATPVWTDEQFLLDNGLTPWLDMPFWLPEKRWQGVLQISNTKAVRAGLQHRPSADTIAAVLDWAITTDKRTIVGLSSDREAKLLRNSSVRLEPGL